MVSLLIVDDDVKLTQMLGEYFSDGNFLVNTAHDAESGLAFISKNNVDLVILDVMLPTIRGFDCLRLIRKKSSVPVIMLTAQGSDFDRVIGLELGADDYMAKPFNPRELRARISAVLRRLKQLPDSQLVDNVVVGPLSLSPLTLEVWADNKPVALTSAEIRVLELLMRSVRQMVSREDLTEQALGRKLVSHDRSIDTHVSNLRRKLGLGQQQGRPSIRSFRGLGYMLLPGELNEDRAVN